MQTLYNNLVSTIACKYQSRKSVYILLTLIMLIASPSYALDIQDGLEISKKALSHEPKPLFKHYGAHVSLDLKYGKQRSLGRLGFVLPLSQQEDRLFYATMIGMLDTKKAKEGNMGAGYRLMHDGLIYGAYSFYDFRKIEKSKLLHQLTFGVEALGKQIELRTNVYIPLQNQLGLKPQQIAQANYQARTNQTIFRTGNGQIFIIPLYGFDIEIGSSIPRLENLSAYMAFYYFNASQVDAIKGIRLRAAYQIINGVSLVAEKSFDTQRKNIGFIGLNLKYTFGGSAAKKSDVLGRKMTQLPVRDIDIVTKQMVRHSFKEVSTFQGNVKFINLNQAVKATGNNIIKNPQTTPIPDDGLVILRSNGTLGCSQPLVVVQRSHMVTTMAIDEHARYRNRTVFRAGDSTITRISDDDSEVGDESDNESYHTDIGDEDIDDEDNLEEASEDCSSSSEEGDGV